MVLAELLSFKPKSCFYRDLSKQAGSSSVRHTRAHTCTHRPREPVSALWAQSRMRGPPGPVHVGSRLCGNIGQLSP